jgi:hypothetical protein
MRAQTARRITLSNGDVGWIHQVGRLPEKRIFRRLEPRPQHLSEKKIEEMLTRAAKETTSSQMSLLASQLGVKVSALMELRVAYGKWTEMKEGKPRHYQAWLFPMRDGRGNLVGIRTRDWFGNKWAVTGSKGGLFYPYTNSKWELYVVEGASDVATMLSMNVWAVGRPSCSSGGADIKTLVERQRVERVIIIADNDDPKKDGRMPGIIGAETLAELLPVPCAIMALPVKDIRAFSIAGGNYNMLSSMARNLVWRNCH